MPVAEKDAQIAPKMPQRSLRSRAPIEQKSFLFVLESGEEQQMLNSAHDGRSGPGVPLQVAWFAGQLGHIEGVVVLEMWNCSLSFRACSRFSRVSVP